MANNGTTGHESEAIDVQGLKAALQKLKTQDIDTKADKTSLEALGLSVVSGQLCQTYNT